MFREALDTLPVAVIMAIVVTFGFRTSREPVLVSPATPATFEAIAEQQARMIRGRALSAPPIGDSGESASTKIEGETSGSGEDTAKAMELRGNEQTQSVFFNRIPASAANGVPFFTSADVPRLPRNNGGSRHELGTAADRRGKTTPTDAGEADRGKIRINHANVEDLMQIPGIGGLKARMIIDGRPAGGFREWKELDAIPGIGAATLSMIQLHATLD